MERTIYKCGVEISRVGNSCPVVVLGKYVVHPLIVTLDILMRGELQVFRLMLFW